MTSSLPRESQIHWEDQIWLKISDAAHNFVSSGLLFFRGECDVPSIRSQIVRASKEYPKLTAYPTKSADGVLRWTSPAGIDVLDNVSVHTLAASVREVDGRVAMDPALVGLLREVVFADLPRARPLWRMVVVDGLRYNGEQAFCLVFTTHHSVADGVAYYDILANICAHPDRGRHHARQGAPADSSVVAAVQGLWGRARYLVRMLVPESTSCIVEGAEGEPQLAMSAACSVAAAAALAKREKVSLNALALAALARSLSEYTRDRSGRTPRRIRAVLPVSVHTRDEETKELINRMGYFHVSLDLKERDVMVLAKGIDVQLKEFKTLGNDEMMRRVARLITVLPSPLTKAAHWLFASRASIVVSCFPFPSTPLRLGSAEAVNIGAFPVIPNPHSMSAMVVTHGGGLTLYMRSSSVDHDLSFIVTRFAEQMRALGERASGGAEQSGSWGVKEERLACTA